jgi:hypothetical protein
MMELDKTAIVLRQRTIPDLLDLSLVVSRVYWKPLLAYAVVGIVPFALINTIVLLPFVDYESLLISNSFSNDESPYRVRYVLYLVGMVFLQAPVAMLGVTYFLGQSLFLEQTSFGEFRRTTFKMLFGLLLILGLFRFGLLAWPAAITIVDDTQIDPLQEFFCLGVIVCGITIVVRAFRPFAPEILMLEQAPLKSNPKKTTEQVAAYGPRSSGLHSPLSGDLVVRGVAILIASTMMLSAVTLCELFVSGVFFGVWTWEWWMDRIVFPINLWIVAIWGTVFRFLSYLDCRTRLNGWELELRLKAERQRLMRGADAS